MYIFVDGNDTNFIISRDRYRAAYLYFIRDCMCTSVYFAMYAL